MTQSNIPADVRERIIAAAAELYDQAGRENLPTVDAVRRAARADMNTTSAAVVSASPGKIALDTWPNGFLNSAAATNRLVATGGAR